MNKYNVKFYKPYLGSYIKEFKSVNVIARSEEHAIHLTLKPRKIVSIYNGGDRYFVNMLRVEYTAFVQMLICNVQVNHDE